MVTINVDSALKQLTILRWAKSEAITLGGGHTQKYRITLAMGVGHYVHAYRPSQQLHLMQYNACLSIASATRFPSVPVTASQITTL